MSEGERLELACTAARAHSDLSEIAFMLRRQTGAKAPTLMEAVKAEGTTSRLKRELQLLDITDTAPEQPY